MQQQRPVSRALPARIFEHWQHGRRLGMRPLPAPPALPGDHIVRREQPLAPLEPQASTPLSLCCCLPLAAPGAWQRRSERLTERLTIAAGRQGHRQGEGVLAVAARLAAAAAAAASAVRAACRLRHCSVAHFCSGSGVRPTTEVSLWWPVCMLCWVLGAGCFLPLCLL